MSGQEVANASWHLSHEAITIICVATRVSGAHHVSFLLFGLNFHHMYCWCNRWQCISILKSCFIHRSMATLHQQCLQQYSWLCPSKLMQNNVFSTFDGNWSKNMSGNSGLQSSDVPTPSWHSPDHQKIPFVLQSKKLLLEHVNKEWIMNPLKNFFCDFNFLWQQWILAEINRHTTRNLAPNDRMQLHSCQNSHQAM